jgi:hypothetical protein
VSAGRAPVRRAAAAATRVPARARGVVGGPVGAGRVGRVRRARGGGGVVSRTRVRVGIYRQHIIWRAHMGQFAKLWGVALSYLCMADSMYEYCNMG